MVWGSSADNILELLCLRSELEQREHYTNADKMGHGVASHLLYEGHARVEGYSRQLGERQETIHPELRKTRGNHDNALGALDAGYQPRAFMVYVREGGILRAERSPGKPVWQSKNMISG